MMVSDMENANEKDQWQLADWLIANVIIKKSAFKKGANL